MAEAFDTGSFDIGSLTWVKDEINRSLKKVQDSYTLVTEKPGEFASLRFTVAHLFQVSGALDMVGLEGCKRYCFELEKLTSKLEKQQVPVMPAVMESLTHAVAILTQYLQDLLNGMPDMPTRLYESLKPLLEVQGESLEITELFFPDTSASAPKALAINALAEFAVPIYVTEQRAAFQKHLLDWLRNADVAALDAMRIAVVNTQQVQTKSAQKTLWWAATALMDALSQEKVASLTGAKKLCRRLDQQLRSMSEGDIRYPSQLLRDVLYYVAISDRLTETINQVKDAFELDKVLPKSVEAGQRNIVSESELAAIAQLSAELPTIKDLWEKVSENPSSGTDLATLVQKLDNLKSAQSNIQQQDVAALLAAIDMAARALQAQTDNINEISAIEMATSLNLAEYIASHYAQLDVEAQAKITTQTARLRAIVDGVPLLPALDLSKQSKLDSQVVSAVAKQILAALQLTEKALDTFFRSPTDAAILAETDKPLEQVSAAFGMLEMPVPKSIAMLSGAFVEHFKVSVGKTEHAHFELVAESLSMLGIYAEALPIVRAESEQALADALARLTQGAASLGLDLPHISEPKTQAELAVHETKSEVISADIVPITTAIDSVREASSSAHAATGDEVVDQAIDDELESIFLEEAEEVLANIAQNLKALTVNGADAEALIELRRAYHTLKGSGRTVGLVGMSQVAWAVEKLLNLMMERKAYPTAQHLDFVERVTGAFSRCVGHLQVDKKVTLNPTIFQKEAAAFEAAFEASLLAGQPKPKEEVLIGGTRKLGLEFFNIFLSDAEQHLATLVQAQHALTVGAVELPSDASCRAAHTLGSNALTAGFEPMGDLARALEYWLDEHKVVWTKQHIALYGHVVNALDEGLACIKTLNNPKSTRTLIAALAASTAKMQAEAAQFADEAILELEKEMQSTGVPVKTLKASTARTEPLKTAFVTTDLIVDDVAVFGMKKPILPVVTKKVTPKKQTNKTANISEPAVVATVVEVQPQLAEVAPLKVPEVAQEKTPKKVQENTSVDQELVNLFVEEARELVPQIGRDLRGWRSNPHEIDYSDSLQRVLHTLKGSARMAGQGVIGDSVHLMEDRVILALRNKVTDQDFEEMFAEFDRIGYMLEDLAGTANEVKAVDKVATATVTPTRAKDRQYQFLRMRADVLDRLINESGEISIMRSRMDREMQNFKQSSIDLTDSITRMRAYLRELELEAETQMQSRMSLLQEANESFDPLEFDRFTRLQELTRMMAESVNDVATIQGGLLLNLDQTDAALQQQNRMNRELQQGLMGVRMLPFATIAERLQRIVRQTARELNKRVEMIIEGESIEIDRGVLDKMGAPLEHLLRNAVAHGLEATAERKELGKPEVGHIKLKVSLENDEITLVVTDDGTGINLAKVKKKAIDKGFFEAQQDISEQALMAVIFEPGFTTAETISQIAGRGVGLDAVRSDIAALSGRIDVSNVAGQGAMFNIYLPVTLSVAQVVMARVGNKMFAIPSVMIEQVQKLKANDLINAYQAQQIAWSDREYPLHYLAKLIGDADQVAEQHAYTPIVLLRSGIYRTALHVDEIIGNQEVVMKQIGTQLTRVPGVIGATVLGDGLIVLVMNPVQLANREALAVGTIKTTSFAPVVEQTRKIALVVDDSLTMRKVLSRVLERADFEVITANDGIDAIQKLQQITPDIILTDIEMPRMDGFEFSRQVRDNAATKQTPLIIISSRTADKHRNLAAEIGVDAFLGKPVQDEDLLAQVTALLNR